MTAISDDDQGLSAAQRLLAACAAEPETDIGNGRRFRRRFGDLAADHEGAASAIAISVAHIGWHVFDGRYWREDVENALVRRLAHKTAEGVRDEISVLDYRPGEMEAISAGEVAEAALDRMVKPEKGDWTDAQKKERFALLNAAAEAKGAREALAERRATRARHAKSTAGSSKLNAIMAEAQPYVFAKIDELNRDRMLFNLTNGTLEFSQVEDEESDPDAPRYIWRAVLREHRQEDFITKLANAGWEPETQREAPEWRKFLQTVQPDVEIRAFLKRFCGYMLTGLVTEQVMLFHYGVGRNGKSTFFDLIAHVFAEYAVTLSIDSFSGDSRRAGAEATPDLARLPGARVVLAAEPEAGVKLKDALIKTLTGGETIPVRRLHKDFFEVEPHFKIMLGGNHKPRIDDDSDGIWRRLLLVPWSVQIPEAEIDRALPRKLRAEADAILSWMVDGAIDYLNHGLGIPDAVRAASAEYRQESDAIGSFIRTACNVTGEDTDRENPLDLFMAFERFADAEGVFKFAQPAFSKRLSKAAERSWPGADGHMAQFVRTRPGGHTVYAGIRIRDDWRPKSGDTGYPEQRG